MLPELVLDIIIFVIGHIIMMDSVIVGSGIEDPHACGCLTDSDCAGLTGIEVYDYI